MVNRNVEWHYLAFAFIVTVLILSGIFFAGHQFNQYKVSELEQRINQIEANQRSMALTYQLSDNLESNRCEAVNTLRKNTLSDLRDLRREAASYEKAERIDNSRYEVVKKKYMNAVVQNLVNLRRMEDCGEDYMEVIYFYSNEDCDACEDQGTVLTFFRRENEDSVRVHPLDTDLDMNSINFLEDYYNVTGYPSIVVDGELYEGFQSKEKLETLLGENLQKITVNMTSEVLKENSSIKNGS